MGRSGAVAAAVHPGRRIRGDGSRSKNGAKQTNSVAITKQTVGRAFRLLAGRSADGQKYDLLIILGPHI